jgi:hypothetical protein
MINLLTTLAATQNKCEDPSFFGLPTWYKYLRVNFNDVTQKCEIDFTLMRNGKFSGSDILLIGLSIIDILIRIAALVAVGFVMYGGIKYITSQGSPEGTKSAQNTIMNGLVGLVIAIVAAAVVAFLGKAVQ